MVMTHYDFLFFSDDYCGLNAISTAGCRFEGGRVA
jgi:hypothetical protein